MQRALARGLFINAVRLESTSYDMYDSSRMGAHTYALIRSGGQGEHSVCDASLPCRAESTLQGSTAQQSSLGDPDIHSGLVITCLNGRPLPGPERILQ